MILLKSVLSDFFTDYVSQEIPYDKTQNLRLIIWRILEKFLGLSQILGFK